MTFIFDLIDIKWFFDNFGEELIELLKMIAKLFGVDTGTDETETQA